MSPVAWGVILILLGHGIHWRVSSRTLNRRNSSERLLFSRYASSAFTRFWKGLAGWLAVLLCTIGGMAILMGLSLA